MKELSKRYKCKWEAPDDYLGMDLRIKPGNISLSMGTFMDRKIQELALVDSYRGDVYNPHYTHKRTSRNDSSSTEPHELYRRKVGSIAWATLGLRFDVAFTHKELSRVFDQHNDHTENTILPRTLAYLIRTKDARVLMDSQATHAYEPPPTRQRHDDIDGSLYEIASEYNLDAHDSSIRSPENEPEPQRWTADGQPIQLVFMTDADLGGLEETRQSTTGIMISADGVPIYWKSKTEKTVPGPLPPASIPDFSRGTPSPNG